MSAPPSLERYRALRAQLATPLPSRYNIAAVTCDRWARGDGRVAMLVPADGEVREIGFDHFASSSARLANGLEALGVGRGDRVSICLEQSVECATAHLAVQRLGAIAVPISTMSGTEAVRHRLVDSGARVLIARWESHAWVAEDDLARELRCVMVGAGVPASVLSLEQLISAGGPVREPADTAIDDPAILIYTSGTTGLPKGALHAQRVVPAHTEPISLAHNIFGGEGDVLWSPADWAWGGGLIDCLFASWQAGRPIVAWRPRGFDPEAVMDVLERCGVTNTFLPPTALKRLRDAGVDPGRGRALGLRSVMTGGEHAGGALIEWTCEAFGVPANEVYGQTEVSAVIGNSATVLPIRPGALGMEYPRTRAAVLDEQGEPAPPGVQGEIALHASTPAMFLGYWRAELGGVDAASAPEWRRTGDLGRVDEDGYFWHEGRRDDLILSSGYRIGPSEIETILGEHPAVAGVAVMGEPDELRGELVSAVVELEAGAVGDAALEAQLKRLVAEKLAPYEVPRRFHFLDVLPRTESGKVRRGELRRLLGGA